MANIREGSIIMTQNSSLTFLIPTYQNLKLLRRYLPSLLREAQTGDQILISEDSPDNHSAQQYFSKLYQLKTHSTALGEISSGSITSGRKKITFTFLQRAHNGRFARNVNDAVSLVTHDYFFLLNDDVKLKPGARRALLQTMLSHPQAFAVGAQELAVHHDNCPSGRNRLWWRSGRFWHERASRQQLAKPGSTAWVCGGSGLYRTKLWRQLGGFDERFYPAYWEDIDISFRARSLGYQVLYEPKSIVEHVHETTNASVFGEAKIVAMSWRAGSKFAWKNANFWQKLQFLFFAPYWQLKQFPALKLWLGVLIFALTTHLSFLTAPPGLSVDEAAIAYNGYGIWQQRRDEWLNRLPVSFRSFGDYKAPLAIYLNGFFTTIFGREIWVIRLPFALISVGSIWLLMLLASLLLKEDKPNYYHHAAALGLLATTSPWLLHFGHLGFENNLALFFTLAGLVSFLTFATTLGARPLAPASWRARFFNLPLFLTSLSWSLALYSYHSAKITLPFLALGLLIIYHRQLQRHFRSLIFPLLLAVLILAPLVYDSFYGQGLQRAGTLWLTDNHLSPSAKLSRLVTGWQAHLSPQFLLFGQVDPVAESAPVPTPNLRHGDGQTGVLNFATFILILVFLISLCLSPPARRQSRLLVAVALTLLLAGLLPAVLATPFPHPNRAYLAFPGFLLLALGGLANWRFLWQKRRQYASAFLYLLLVLQALFFLSWRQHYLKVFTPTPTPPPALSASHQLISQLYAQNLLDACRHLWQLASSADQILIASGREHEYLYVLLATGAPPISWQHGALNQFKFVNRIQAADLARPRTLLLFDPTLAPADLAPAQLVKQYFDNSGAVNLVIYQTP
jgi:GT2 family glycosyltransferase